MKKKIDPLGRVVIPKPIREALGLEAGSSVVIHCDAIHKEITLLKEKSRCSACGSPHELQQIGRIYLCQSCVRKLKP